MAVSAIGAAHFSAGASNKHCRGSCSRSKKIRITRSPTAISPHVMPIWAGRRGTRNRGAAARHHPLVVSSADYLPNVEQRELLMSGLRLAAGEAG
jgi:hypothetical protein